MNGDLNKGEYKAMEQLWADSINSGKNVSGTINLSYTGNSFRPDSFDVLYDIGEGIVEKIFANL
jgi:filamentous hemagglutinin